MPLAASPRKAAPLRAKPLAARPAVQSLATAPTAECARGRPFRAAAVSVAGTPQVANRAAGTPQGVALLLGYFELARRLVAAAPVSAQLEAQLCSELVVQLIA